MLIKKFVPTLLPPNPADVVIALGHPANSDGTPSRAIKEEVALAVQLYKLGLAKAIIFTGGAVRNHHIEAEVMANLARASGVPAEAVIVEASSRDTRENALNSKKILSHHGWTSVTLVTTPYHVRRASRIFRSQGIPHNAAYASNSYQFQSSRLQIWLFFRELAGYVWALVSEYFQLEPFWSVTNDASRKEVRG